jgi:hypothetical protein
VTRARPTALAVLLLCAATVQVRTVAAQSAVTQPQRYLLGVDAMDARALWVQPAGLSGRREASIDGMFTLEDGSELREYGLTVSSGGLGLGWQHDRLPDGRSGDQWAVGFALGNPLVGLGAVQRWFKGGGTDASATDIGFRYQPGVHLRMSLGWHNIGSPEVRDSVIPETLVPGASLLLFGGRVGLGAEWTVATDGWSSNAIRAGATVGLPWRLALSFRGDFDGSFEGRGFSLSLTWNGSSARVTSFWAAPDPGVASVGFWGGAVRDLSAPIRRR